MPTEGAPPSRGISERATITLTNLGKLAGIAIGVNEALFGAARPPVLLLATAFYMGAQAVEDLVLKIIDRALPK